MEGLGSGALPSEVHAPWGAAGDPEPSEPETPQFYTRLQQRHGLLHRLLLGHLGHDPPCSSEEIRDEHIAAGDWPKVDPIP